MTEPPGRALSPTEPRDAAARRAWMNVYEKAGGRVVNATRGPRLGAPVMLCRDPWVEFRYYHCDGSPVSGARYVARVGDFSASGMLDDDGFARVEGLPKGTNQVTYTFEDDPETYVPRPPTASVDTPASRIAVGQVFGDVLHWLWGTIQGDFHPDPTLSQTAVNTVVGLIPIADQVLDARDLVAGIKHLIEFYMEDEEHQRAHDNDGFLGLSYETLLWVGVFLTAIGCIPELGSAVKGVLKALLYELRQAGHIAKELGGQQLRRIWELLVACLNFFGHHQGNAHRWLKELPGRLSGLMNDAAKLIRVTAEAFRRFLDDVDISMRLWRAGAPEWLKKTLDSLGRAKGAVGRLFERLEHQKQRINAWLREQLNHVLGKRGVSGGTGVVNTHVPARPSEPHPPPGNPPAPPPPPGPPERSPLPDSPERHPPPSSGGGSAGSGNGPPTNGPNEVVQQATPPPEPALPPRPVKRTQPTGPKGGKPTGKRTKVRKGANAKSDELENGAADVLADHGYKVEQNPGKLPNGKDPDYKIEGEVFDCLSPESRNPSSIVDRMGDKVGSGQTERVVLNLDATTATPESIREQIMVQMATPDSSLTGLKEVIVVKGGKVTTLFP